MGAMKVGNGLDDGVEVGSLVNKEARDKVVELVEDAVKQGAKVLTGGSMPDGQGFFYQPTVLVDVPEGAMMLDEEIFGPVAAHPDASPRRKRRSGARNDTITGLSPMSSPAILNAACASRSSSNSAWSGSTAAWSPIRRRPSAA